MNINRFFKGLKAMLLDSPRKAQIYSGMGAIVHSQGVAFRVWRPTPQRFMLWVVLTTGQRQPIP